MIYRFDLPLPPTFNEMKELLKKGRHGVVYRSDKNAYMLRAKIAMRAQHRRPPEPHPRWKIISMTFYRHNKADPIELMSGLKWPVDQLVREGYFKDDSPRELIEVPYPIQFIERRKERQKVILVCEGLAPAPEE